MKRILNKPKFLLNHLNDHFSLDGFMEEIKVSLQRDRLWYYVRKSKPIKVSKPSKNCPEIMSLVSHKDLLLLLVCLKTFFYFLKKIFSVTVVDDGSMNREDIKFLKYYVKNIRFIGAKEADKRAKSYLKGKKLCFQYGKIGGHPYVRKSLFLPILSVSRKILLLDSDIIFFKKPTEIIDFFKGNNNLVIFMSDYQDAYSISGIEAKYFFNCKLIKKLNSGILGFNSKEIDLDLAEKFLKYWSNSYGRLFQMQTFYSLLFSKKDKNKVVRLPNSYFLDFGYRHVKEIICRHYVGIKEIRLLFYKDAMLIMKKISKNE